MLFLVDIPGAFDFVSTNSLPAPFLVAVSLESDREDSESGAQAISRRALHRAVGTQGKPSSRTVLSNETCCAP